MVKRDPRRRFLYFSCGTAVVLAGALVATPQDRLNLDQILTGHRAGLGPAMQEQNPSRTLHGVARYTAIVGQAANLQGTLQVASQEKRLNLRLIFNNSQYPGERLIFDGKQSFVDYINVGVRSNFGQFLHQQNQILESGLFGGVLTAGWPLLGPLPEGTTLEYEGLKKRGDVSLHTVRYRLRKGGGDTEIRLYFEPDTFHHVASEYRVTITPGIGFGETDSARRRVIRIILEETFSGFQTVQGLTLPGRWRIRLADDRRASIQEWLVVLQSVDVNMPQDPALFIPKP